METEYLIQLMEEFVSVEREIDAIHREAHEENSELEDFPQLKECQKESIKIEGMILSALEKRKLINQKSNLFERVIEKARNMTPEEGLEKLVELGTHHADGSLTEEYGGEKREKHVIDLIPHHNTCSLVMSGEENGAALRKEYKLNEEDKLPRIVTVIIASEVVCINMSFFLGMFRKSVKKLGKIGFKNKYRFEGDWRIDSDIERGIRAAINI